MKAAEVSVEEPSGPDGELHTPVIALIGNPNCGKTTLFNALTGLRQKVGNYPGITVEKKEGRLQLPNHDDGSGAGPALLIDLPGLYSLTPDSPDETIAREVLLGLRADTPRPDVLLNVVDASNLERNLYLTCQLIDTGVPMVIALTMTDAAEAAGMKIRALQLQRALGIPVCAVVASRKQGIDRLLRSLSEAVCKQIEPELTWQIPEAYRREATDLQDQIGIELGLTPRLAFSQTITLLVQERETGSQGVLSASLLETLRATKRRLQQAGVDMAAQAIEARYAWVESVTEGVVERLAGSGPRPVSWDEKIDHVVMHPFWGYVIFFAMMSVLFQAVFSWVQAPMNWIKNGVEFAGQHLVRVIPAGELRDLVHGGVVGGVGNTLVFLPQILLLFFFVSLLEDTGYMARAAFLMDRLMSRVGLHGKSFIPLVSSFACAIPGIMATRTIGDRKARLITILIAPLMSCSARLPVYTLMIGALIPARRVMGIGPYTLLTLPGLTMMCMYFSGMAIAFLIAGLFHRTLLRGVSPSFVLELPPYRLPRLRTALLEMGERSGLFLRRAGTVILAVSVVLWALSTYPKVPASQHVSEEAKLGSSYVGRIGHTLEPIIRPLGFDWKIGIGMVSSFVAREVFVSAMGTVYNVHNAEDTGQVDLRERLRSDRDPVTGKHIFTPLTAICVMLYYVLAMQCISTVAVVRRETNGWRWPLFQIGYMTCLAWGATFVVFRIGTFMGWGV